MIWETIVIDPGTTVNVNAPAQATNVSFSGSVSILGTETLDAVNFVSSGTASLTLQSEYMTLRADNFEMFPNVPTDLTDMVLAASAPGVMALLEVNALCNFSGTVTDIDASSGILCKNHRKSGVRTGAVSNSQNWIFAQPPQSITKTFVDG